MNALCLNLRRRAFLEVLSGVIFAKALQADIDPARLAVEQAFEQMRLMPWMRVWRSAHLGSIRMVSQSPKQLYQLGMKPVWVATVFQGSDTVGYLMLEAESPYRWVEFGVDAEAPFESEGLPGKAIDGIPNLQQFPVRGKMAERVASGCVPTAGANMIGYWARHGFPKWLDSGESEDGLRVATQRLRALLPIAEFPDDAGYTDQGMPLTGSHASGIAAALAADAERFRIPLKTRVGGFQRSAFETEISEGRPVLICCEARLPHKPHLSWGHAVTAIGWTEFYGAYFVMIRDNFYPTKSPDAVRWLRSDAISEMVLLQPK